MSNGYVWSQTIARNVKWLGVNLPTNQNADVVYA